MFKKNLLVIAFLLLSNTLYANDKAVGLAGDILAALIPIGSYAGTFYMDDSKGRIAFYKSIGTTVAVTYALKLSINAPRPDKSNNNSFPSGHTSLTFSSAVFLHKRYGFKSALPAYIGAAFVGYSRVYAKKHYTRDVIAGAAIGALSSWFFTDKLKKIKLNAVVVNNYTTLLVTYKF
ncbi:phosphatase PAP2 family protein [Sulfurimonas sp. SAG-AH-194-C21]|nr:phosphatase PAP2 family protein [Sulfurimonas sp. SAG-AH-194-C21]MDF1882962.1 phosphatase PAP2 family protein [Sulfurimonas sp. SAG-AH-194-C21]